MPVRLLAAGIVAAIASAALSASGVDAAPPLRPLTTGVVQPTAWPLAATDRDAAYARIAAAGATVTRIGLSWRQTAPTRPAAPADPDDPAYDWSQFDGELAAAGGAGLKPLVSVNDTPPWAEGTGGSGNYKPNIDAFAAFARAAATRYDGTHAGLPRIRYWQAWIEPNVNEFFAPQFGPSGPVSPGYYRSLLNGFAASVHAVHADNLVVSAGLSPFTVQLGDTRTIGPLRFMRLMLCMSAGAKPKPTCRTRVHFDVWSHHPYTTGGPQHHAVNPDDASLGDLPKMKALLDAAIRAGHVVSSRPVQFWVTEFSWDTKPPDPHAVPIALQARWTSEALYRMWSVGIDLVVWLQLRDEPYPSSPNQGGLYYRGSSFATDLPKPTLTAFRFPFVAYTRTARSLSIWGRTPDSRAGPVTIQESVSGGGWRTIASVRANRFGIFAGTVRGSGTPAGRVRATVGSAPASASLPFSLRVPPDRTIRPFG